MSGSTPGAPIWIELFTPDTDAAERFYGELFGWTAQKSGEEHGGYIVFHHEGRQVAGCMRNDGSMGPNAWSVYLSTADVAATADQAKAAGGTVVVAPMQVGDMGHMLFVTDPGGGAVGAWQPLAHTGFATEGEPGTPVWFELHTRDYAGSVGFYEKAFGWDAHTASDTDDFRYTTLGEGDAAQAGIMDATAFLPEGVPAQWSIYFLVTDADAAIARTEQLGGSVVQAAADTPYGRLATVADPAGLPFKLLAR